MSIQRVKGMDGKNDRKGRKKQEMMGNCWEGKGREKRDRKKGNCLEGREE